VTPVLAARRIAWRAFDVFRRLARTRAVACRARDGQQRQRGPAEQVIVDLKIDDETRGATLDAASPVLQGLSDLRFFAAGSLVATKDEDEEGITRTPLITTTAQGGTLEMKPGFPEGDSLVFLDMNDPAKLIGRFTPGDKPVVLAYQVQGKLPSLYPEGADVPEETPAPPPGLPPPPPVPPPMPPPPPVPPPPVPPPAPPPVGEPHTPLRHASPPGQLAHSAPPVPHSMVASPSWQVPRASQHPSQDDGPQGSGVRPQEAAANPTAKAEWMVT